MPLLIAGAVLLPLGCTDDPVPTRPGADASTGELGTTSGASTSATPGSTTQDDADESQGTTESPADDALFLAEPDLGNGSECDIFVQDCPPGLKCMPWSKNGSIWDATGCRPVAADPAEVDEPCHVEGSGTSGIDDCMVGAMCWDVDPETGEGICVPFCSGSEAVPICEDPHRQCSVCGDCPFLLCLPVCDPVDQDCPEGEACYPLQDYWKCAPDASGEGGGYGDPCEYINVCDPGLICLGTGAVPPGEACEGAAGCCTEVCDLSDPLGDMQCTGAAGGQQCVPWYDDGYVAPPGYEDVGVCAVPA